MSRRSFTVLFIASVLCAAAATGGTDASWFAPGPHGVSESLFDWRDGGRKRDVPVKVYSPLDRAGPCHVVVLSHGLGGSREGYACLGRHWASHGYVSIHLQHAGSDDSVWRDARRPLERMRQAANRANAVDRVRDVSFVLDQLPELEARLGLALVMDRAAAAGHSFGANTTLLLAGQAGGAFRDDRIVAGVPMSAPVPDNPRWRGRVWDHIKVPLMHMTGTHDGSIVSSTTAADRRVPFDHIRGAEQYLITLQGGDHMVFSGRPRAWGGDDRDGLFQGLIRGCTTAFWAAQLCNDAAARAWLGSGGLDRALEGHASVERRR